MTIVDLLSKETAGEGERLVVVASLAGVGNTLVLALVNAAVAKPERPSPVLIGLFIVAVGLFIFGARYTYRRTTDLVETTLHRIRTRVVAKIERAELESMERVGAVEVMDRITENISVISESAGALARLLQSLCVILFAIVYLVYLLLPAFAVGALILLVGASAYLAKEREIYTYLRQAALERVVFGQHVTDLLRGFKEVKFSRRRGRDLREDTAKSSEQVREATIKAEGLLTQNYVFADVNLFVLLSALAVVLPQYIPTPAPTMTALISGVLFLWGPIGSFVGSHPAYVRSNNAIAQLEVLEEKLDTSVSPAPLREPTHEPWGGRFTTIEARDLEYKYAGERGDQAFRIGPINLSIEAGEVVFIVGGNGSGKSTFLKVLTGLYPPSAGELRVDGARVEKHNAAVYREMISAIYSDFHLFAKLYGLEDVEKRDVDRLLAQMDLRSKTNYQDHRFTMRNLSTGQKKRLAMVVVLLEDRPLYVFDEWAADQDPEFRKYFYEELIPSLKRQGKTVIAVSHDDRYFGCADRVVTMEYGTIRSIERGAQKSAFDGAPRAEKPNL